jgi:penicillin-binding protein 2
MPSTETNLADRSGNLVEARKNYDPRVIFFYFVLAAMLLTLAGGLAYQQLSKAGEHNLAERHQNTRRVIIPGPRGRILDREGRILVGNTPRWTVVLHLDDLQSELISERKKVKANFASMTKDKKDLPSGESLETLSRLSLVQRYLDRVDAIVGRDEKVDRKALDLHFQQHLLLPFTLIDNLEASEYARLIERLPVKSPLEVYAKNTRYYPYKSAAAHMLGYVRPFEDIDDENLPGSDEHMKTFPMMGTIGIDGLEKTYDAQLQGEAGGRVYRVTPSGFKIDPPLEEVIPKRGKDLTTSLDIDLQLVAEEAIGDQTGAAVVLDVATGEVLVLASKPDYDLNRFSPRASQDVVNEMNASGAWYNNAIASPWPPGSTFKILNSIAALRRGVVSPDRPIVDCDGFTKIGNRLFPCENGRGHHGEILLPQAIAHSCDIYFYEVGRLVTPDGIAAEAHRFHLDEPTHIALPHETTRMLIPTPAWKKRTQNEAWYPGDSANMGIGQGAIVVTPLQMACFVASVARGETTTIPLLVHQPNRPPQHTEAIGLTSEQRAAIISGMEGCTQYGTAAPILGPTGVMRLPNVRIAGKTGTAQKKVVKEGKLGTINYAWFICFAPIEKPEIAVAVAIEGENIGESFEGSRNAAPIASTILQKYFAKKANPAAAIIPPIRTE